MLQRVFVLRAGHEDDGQVLVARAQQRRERERAALGQLLIDEQAVELLAGHMLDGLGDGTAIDDVSAQRALLDHAHEIPAVGRIVIDDKQPQAS